MSNKKSGFLPLVAGFVAGAAAVFFSKKENRQKASAQLKKVTSEAKKLSEEYQKDPEAFKRKVKTKGKKMVEKVLKSKPKPTKKTTQK